MKFNPGDIIIKIGGTLQYSVMLATSERYELFWEKYGLYKFPKDYVEENFVLVETAKESANGGCDYDKGY